MTKPIRSNTRIGLASRALATTTALLFWAGPTIAVDCPQPQNQASPNAIQEAEKEVSALAPLLSGEDLENRVGVIVSDLRKRHPDVGKEELVNFLMTAYCPIVNKEALSEDVKSTKLKAFSDQVIKFVYQ